jgi:hypothetical protein
MHFVSEVELCSVCGEPLLVYKTTTPRCVITLTYGKFQAVEVVRYCGNGCVLSEGESSLRLYRSEFLAKLVAPYHIYGFDVVAKVGIQRFLHCRQRKEIQAEIDSMIGVSIPEGTIQTLIGRFMDAVRGVHEENIPKLREIFESDGGYILHVDGTCEEGSHVHFVCLTGPEPIVLWSEKIESENAAEIQRVLKEVDRRFGRPAATVQDLSSAIRKAVLAQWPKLPIFYCHYHFLADVGKDILGDHYKRIRGLLRDSEIRPELRRFLKSITKELGERREEARRICRNLDDPEFLKQKGRSLKATSVAAGIAEWILSAKAEGTGRSFPYDLPHLIFCLRAQRALEMVDRDILPWLTGRTPRGEKLLLRLRGILHCFLKSRKLARAMRQIQESNIIFVRLRDALRLSAKGIAGRRNAERIYQSPQEVRDAEEAVTRLRDELRLEFETDLSPEVEKSIKIVLGHLEKYWDGLFGHCLNISDDGQRYLMVQRTNNLAECFFRGIKRVMRRITGKKRLNREVDALPGHAFLVFNLKSLKYVELVCGSLDRLPEAFADLSRKGKFPKASATERARGFLDRKNRRKPDFPAAVACAYATE